jgi:transposase InsO family protein
VTDRYQRIATMEKEYPLTVLCRVFGVSRSGYHAWRTRPPSVRQQANDQLLAAIRRLHQGPERCYGSPRLTPELKALGHACSENRVARLMQRHGVRAQKRKRFVPRTTDSDHDHPIAPNRLAERSVPTGPNQVWVSDLTYVLTAQGWLYLALVMDLWSRRIVGWAMAEHLRSELVLAALEMAVTHRRPTKGLILHSDRGVQYASTDTRQFLAAQGLVASMSRAGNPYDNAWMESAIGKIKSEVFGETIPADREKAQQQLFVGLECWYNQRRRHSALNYQSPVAFETQFMKN